MNIGIELLLDNVGMSFEWVIMLILILGSMIFAAKDFKISLITLIVSMAGLFVWFYEKGYNYSMPLVVFFMGIVVLALSLYAVSSSSQTGGFS